MGLCNSKAKRVTDIRECVHNNQLNNNETIQKNTNDLNNYISHIKDYKFLTFEMVFNIENMSNEEKMIIINTYNNVTKRINDLLASS